MAFRQLLLHLLLLHIFWVTTSLRCGGTVTLELDRTSALDYASDKPFLENERCVWFFEAVNASSYDVNVTFVGFPPGEISHRLVLTEMSLENSRVENHVVVSEPLQHSTGNAAMLMVTFQTGPINSQNHTGFSLTVTPRTDPDSSKRSENSVTLFIDNENGTIRHPESGTYSNLEMSVFLFLSPNNTQSDSLRTDVLYTRFSIGLLCSDGVHLYKYDRNHAEEFRWRRSTVLCGGVEQAATWNWDMIMFVFRTDALFVFEGFQLEYKMEEELDYDLEQR